MPMLGVEQEGVAGQLHNGEALTTTYKIGETIRKDQF